MWMLTSCVPPTRISSGVYRLWRPSCPRSTTAFRQTFDVRPHCPVPVGHGYCILHPWSGHSLGRPPSLPCPCWPWLQHPPPLVWPQPGTSALTALSLLAMAAASSTPGLATAWDVRPHCPVPVGHGCSILHPWSGHSLGRPPSLPCPCWTWLLHRPALVWPQPGRSSTASHEPDYQALLASALQHLLGATQLTPKQGESISAPGGDARP